MENRDWFILSNVKAVGAYRSINVSWKDMKSTDSYNVFYREKGNGEYIEAVSKYEGTSYTITSLKDNTKYEVYVTGNNKKGTGPASLVSEATTVNILPAQLPQYKLLNTSNGEGKHLNIRYQRMFAGAFMYAGGNHIGIEWGSVSGLSNGIPFEAAENGKYLSGSLFGWGIAHEIGHNSNSCRNI